jgi:GTPase
VRPRSRLDRRRINSRIAKLRREIKDMKTVRDTKRGSRRGNEVPSVAIAGLHQRRQVEPAQPAHRRRGARRERAVRHPRPDGPRAETPDGREYTLADTVGFVRHLPHQLVEAFRSTLEEVAEADLLLHVVDGSHPTRRARSPPCGRCSPTSRRTEVKEVIVVNKADIADPTRLTARVNEDLAGELARYAV